MKLEYNVLWIDDQPNHVRSFRERIDRHLSEQGFELTVTVVSRLDEVDAAVGHHVHDDGIDLVMVDYDLGPGSGGELALEVVRARFPHKDILFYSAADPAHLRRIAFDAELDGVYFSTRMSLSDDAISIIDKTLHKVMDLDHMRGIVMAATSDIDLFVERTVVSSFDRLDDEAKAGSKARIIELIGKKLQKWDEELKRAADRDGIERLIKLRHLYTASDRLQSLITELETLATGGRTLLEAAQEYRDNLVPRRNKLAHLVIKTVGGQRVLEETSGGSLRMDVAGMCELRKDLLRHRKNFEEIAVIVDVEFD